MNKSIIIAEPGHALVSAQRDFVATAEQLYRAHTEPDLIVQWWGVFDGMTTTIDSFEPAFGGKWRIINTTADGQEHIFRGVYHTVEPTLIVTTFEYEPLPGHVCMETTRFIEKGDITTLHSVTSFSNVEDRDGMVNAGMEYGREGGYDSLDNVLAVL